MSYSRDINKSVLDNFSDVEDQLDDLQVDTVKDDIRRALDDGSFTAPDYPYLSDLIEIWQDNDLEDGDEVSLDDIENAAEAVTREAEAKIRATYDRYLNQELETVEDALEEAVDYLEGEGFEIENIKGGSAGLDNVTHDYEADAGMGTLYVWRSMYKAQLTIEKLNLIFELERPDEDVEDEE